MAQQEPISPTAADLMEGERSEATARITRNESAQPRPGGSLVQPFVAYLTKGCTEKPSRFGHRASEFVIESLIRLCGISAIIFIFAIFFFVFREAAPILKKIDFYKFFFTTAWYPTSMGTPRYGVWALIVGTFSVTAL